MELAPATPATTATTPTPAPTPATPKPVEPVSTLPSDVQTYFDHGRADFLWKNYDEAISDYTKVISLDARSAEAYYNRGLAYRQLGKDAQAQADFKKAKQLGYTVPQ
jgi:tetratricopeptide (TPR) repeat protein